MIVAGPDVNGPQESFPFRLTNKCRSRIETSADFNYSTRAFIFVEPLSNGIELFFFGTKRFNDSSIPNYQCYRRRNSANVHFFPAKIDDTISNKSTLGTPFNETDSVCSNWKMAQSLLSLTIDAA